MSIDIRRSHSQGLEKAREHAEAVAARLAEKLEIQWRWDGNTIRFHADRGKARGVKGTIDVTATDVRVQIDLPFLLRALKGMIEKKIEEKLAVFT